MRVGKALALALALASVGPGVVRAQQSGSKPGAAAQPGPASGPASVPPDGQPPGEKPVQKPPKREQPGQAQAHDAASVAGAPTPDQARGIERAEPDGAGNKLRVIPRIVLFPARVVLAVVDAPFRGGFWLYERYQLRNRFKAIFFNDTGTVGLYPVAFVETGFGLNAGLRFIHRDLYRKASLKARASFGGPFQQIFAVKLGSGELFSDQLEVGLEAEYEARPKDRFFGIGNGDTVEAVPAPVDPYEDPAAVDTRFRQTVSHLSAGADLHVAGPLSARLSSALVWKTFDQSEAGDIPADKALDLSYDPAALPGFVDGVSYSYNELELRLDTRSAADRYEMSTLPSTGWLLSGFGGLARDFGTRERVDYLRYGVDLQRYIRLAQNPRLIALRVYVEGVSGDDDEIPFVDLPRLGGPLLLRGYLRDRFRDRVLGLASIEYQFDIGHMFTGFLFGDAGRVYPALSDVKIEDIRLAYGGGLQMQTPKSFIGRVSVATSTDGGLIFNFSFDPVYDPKARVERK